MVHVYNSKGDFLFNFNNTSSLLDIYDEYCRKYNENDYIYFLNDGGYSCVVQDWKNTAKWFCHSFVEDIYIMTRDVTDINLINKYNNKIQLLRNK